MADAPKIDIDPIPSPLPPGDGELAAWNRLSRADQVQHVRDYLSHPDCDTFTNEGPDEILAAAQVEIAARKGA